MRLKNKYIRTITCAFLLTSSYVSADSGAVSFSSKETFDDEAFGVQVAIDKDLAIIGTFENNYKGAVYVYRYINGSWDNILRLQPDDLSSWDGFGAQLDLDASSQTIVIGALWQDQMLPSGDVLNDAGAAYVYQLPVVHLVNS